MLKRRKIELNGEEKNKCRGEGMRVRYEKQYEEIPKTKDQ